MEFFIFLLLIVIGVFYCAITWPLQTIACILVAFFLAAIART